MTSAVATGAQVAGRCAGAQVVGATAPPSRLARRTGPRRLRRELRRGLQRGLRRGLRRPLRRCNRGGACGQTRKGRVDGGLRAMRRRMIRPSCELTVRAGGGRSGPSERKTRPKPASGVDGQSTAPHKVNPLAHDGHGWCHGGDRHPHRDGRPGLRDSVDCGVASRPTRRRQLGRSRHFRVACLCWGCCAERRR